jgi:hypothetical protein
MTPLQIGLAFLPMAVAIGVLSLGFSERLAMRFGAKPTTPDDSGLASGLVNTSLQVGGALGLAVLATLSANRTDHVVAAGSSRDAAVTTGFTSRAGSQPGSSSRRSPSPCSGDRERMTNELVHWIATGRIVHPTVPSFANMFGHPDVVYVPIADMRPLQSALVWRRGTADRQVHEFAQIAEDIAGRPDDAADPARSRAS